MARKVLDAIDASRHVRANIYLDRELAFVAEADSPGVSATASSSSKCSSSSARELPHEEIIAKLDSVSQVFRVLIIKTDLKIPYTSIFFELDCGYWTPEAEQRLRRASSKSSRTF